MMENLILADAQVQCMKHMPKIVLLVIINAKNVQVFLLPVLNVLQTEKELVLAAVQTDIMKIMLQNVHSVVKHAKLVSMILITV